MHIMFSVYSSDIGACFFSSLIFFRMMCVRYRIEVREKGLHWFLNFTFGNFEICENIGDSGMDGACNPIGDDLWGENHPSLID